jgi:hypothetical protein
MGTLNPTRGGTVGNAQYVGRTKWARAYYDFATDGGAIGALTLRGDKIPAGARVLSTYVDVATVVTSGGAATVSIGIESATDVRAAVILGTAPALNAVATPIGLTTPATSAVTTTVSRDVVATIAAATLTAGRFSVLVAYIELSSQV